MGPGTPQVQVPRHVAVKILRQSIKLIETKVRAGGKLAKSLRRLAMDKRLPSNEESPLSTLLRDLSGYLDSYQESDRRELSAYKEQLRQIESPIDLSAGGIRPLLPRKN